MSLRHVWRYLRMRSSFGSCSLLRLVHRPLPSHSIPVIPHTVPAPRGIPKAAFIAPDICACPVAFGWQPVSQWPLSLMDSPSAWPGGREVCVIAERICRFSVMERSDTHKVTPIKCEVSDQQAASQVPSPSQVPFSAQASTRKQPVCVSHYR